MSFQFYKSRSVSEVIVDTFQFTKSYSRPFLRKILPLVVIYTVLVVIIFVATAGGTQGITMMSGGGIDPMFIFSTFSTLISYVFLFAIMLSGLLVVRFVHQNESPDEFDLGYQLRKYLPGFFVLAILYGVTILLGTILLIIPGIYLFIALYSSYGVYIIERKGVVESLKRAYELSKGAWWLTLGTLILMYLLNMGIALLAGFPAIIIGFLAGMNPEMIGLDGSFNLAFFILLVFGTLSSIVSFLFYGIWGIYMGILYFTLRERKEGDSIADEMSDFESELSDEQFSDDDAPADDSFTDSDPDSDRNNPDWR